ncbi:phosphatidylinositol 3,4,5-trisphosphate 3-phosphatase and dual-specificity protein phosphatase PTEN isoform X8 [Cherax quadricarinatus]|uniref:phosphatidylinositol 3,4,5-trisphosphate 3-phosphatase and dual-specificity protein phosphatase PTEN isoform X8 n=1 Tax=Cherax quadricarinatus TaxID=27406 RepID=UPI0023788AB0|nr:phosphatidylinositol 3,4,5-trisphosphate 3-phosphatase and dual-specificity protein phosphatase PTEN-like isoform X8 [Cherax quadricarinatus]
MSKGIRNLVSKRKRRFKEDGYDLDLSYITDRLIAMGFPAQKLEGVYRNHIDDVCRFLEERHKDHYRIYNLCSERNRCYDAARFHNRVRTFPFADHNPPPLIDIEPLCKDMADWLNEDQKNVAVVHCKAGKGRTGVMICCYLLHCRFKILAQDALDFYGDKRTFDRKGVTIPSQRRYVEYYAKLVTSNFNYNPPYVRLREARMTAPLSSVNSEVYLVISSHSNKKGYSSQQCDVRKGKETIYLPVKDEVARPISGDIKIELKRTNFVRRTDKLFSAWLNTHFIFEEGKKLTNGCEITASDQNNHNTCTTQNIRQSVCGGSGDSWEEARAGEQEVLVVLKKDQLDKASKDTHHKLLPEDFQIELWWMVTYVNKGGSNVLESRESGSTPSTITPSGSSSDTDDDDDDEEDEDWDSGRRLKGHRNQLQFAASQWPLPRALRGSISAHVGLFSRPPESLHDAGGPYMTLAPLITTHPASP